MKLLGVNGAAPADRYRGFYIDWNSVFPILRVKLVISLRK